MELDAQSGGFITSHFDTFEQTTNPQSRLRSGMSQISICTADYLKGYRVGSKCGEALNVN